MADPFELPEVGSTLSPDDPLAPAVADARRLTGSVLEEVDADNVDGDGEKITSLKKLLMQKRNRSGYDT